MFTKRKIEEPVIDVHPFAEVAVRFPDDILLRQYGFKIHSRKENQSPIWSRGNKLYCQQKALDRIYRIRQQSK